MFGFISLAIEQREEGYMHRTGKIIIIGFILAGLIAASVSCSSETDETGEAETRIVTVQRGNLTIDITAAGNLDLSRTEELAFEVAGTVAEVLVEEGDPVEEGQVLASLDKEEWDEELSALEDKITDEERDLLQAQINLKTAEQSLKNTQDNQATKELALLNAQISLDQVNYNLEVAQGTYTWPEIQIAEADIERIKAWLEYAFESRAASGNPDSWDRLVTRYQAELNAAENTLNAMLQGYDTEEIAIKRKQVEAAEMSLAQAQTTLDKVAEEAAEDLAIKEQQLTLSHGRLEDAEKALSDAQAEWEEAKGKIPVITAPFAGFITKVNVEGGDEVLKGTVAVHLADPSRFEADILVSEMDILQVKEGGEAWVEVDAMQGMALPAKVTHIAPTATIQSGVVNYAVRVELQSMEAVVRERRQQVIGDMAAGELPERLRQAVEAGQITQEQAEEMMGKIPGGQGELPGQTPAAIPENFLLREGLTVTVSIVVEEKNDVLLVPYAAITSRGGQSYVEVVLPSGTTEQRAIQTGITDYQFTEVTGGLDEGEQILVPQGAAVSPTASSGGQRGGLSFMRPPQH